MKRNKKFILIIFLVIISFFIIASFIFLYFMGRLSSKALSGQPCGGSMKNSKECIEGFDCISSNTIYFGGGGTCVSHKKLWKTFEIKEIKISIEYPFNWKVEETSLNKEVKSALIKGNEGEMVLNWGGAGYENVCLPENTEVTTVLNQRQEVCRKFDEEKEIVNMIVTSKNKQYLQVLIRTNRSLRLGDSINTYEILSSLSYIE